MFTKDLFSGKIALVTGGGTGIGLAIAKQLLMHGAEVYIASRKQEHLDKAMTELSPLGKAHALVLDIRDREQVTAVLDTIQQQSGRLDILMNNAGGQFPSRAEEITPNGWNAVINTNLNGTWNVTQEAFKRFFEPQKAGKVVTIIVNLYRGFPGMAHTAAARGGIEAFTKTLAVEWANRNVQLNCVAPGIILSSGLDQYPPELLKGITDKILMKRLGTTDEVAYSALFLASPMAAYITGETLYVDGGQRLWGDMWEV